MGVLARLFRRSRATEEAAAETVTETAAEEEATATSEAPVGTPEDGAEADRAAHVPSATEPNGVGESTETEAGAVAGGAAVAAADGVEIPRQQSAEEVADSEAGEGAHT